MNLIEGRAKATGKVELVFARTQITEHFGPKGGEFITRRCEAVNGLFQVSTGLLGVGIELRLGLHEQRMTHAQFRAKAVSAARVALAPEGARGARGGDSVVEAFHRPQRRAEFSQRQGLFA